MTVTPVPASLEQAIQRASATYGVPHDLLEGIWRVESGSTYPNPAVNSLGYGGLFGTHDAFGPTQEQANLSASILASDIRMAGGSIAGGLSFYSGGGGSVPPSRGYSSVPGETTFGFLNIPGGAAAPQISPGDAGSPGVQSVSLVPNVSRDVSGSVKEAFVRVAELVLAALLAYLGLKTLASVLSRAQPVAGQLSQLNETLRNLRPAPAAPAAAPAAASGGGTGTGLVLVA